MIKGIVEGVVIARGNLFLGQEALVRGILIHLGWERLSLGDRSQVEEGIGMSNLQPQGIN